MSIVNGLFPLFADHEFSMALINSPDMAFTHWKNSIGNFKHESSRTNRNRSESTDTKMSSKLTSLNIGTKQKLRTKCAPYPHSKQMTYVKDKDIEQDIGNVPNFAAFCQMNM